VVASPGVSHKRAESAINRSHHNRDFSKYSDQFQVIEGWEAAAVLPEATEEVVSKDSPVKFPTEVAKPYTDKSVFLFEQKLHQMLF